MLHKIAIFEPRFFTASEQTRKSSIVKHVETKKSTKLNNALECQMFRDYVGWAWYDTQFFVFQGWQSLMRLLCQNFHTPLTRSQ